MTSSGHGTFSIKFRIIFGAGSPDYAGDPLDMEQLSNDLKIPLHDLRAFYIGQKVPCRRLTRAICQEAIAIALRNQTAPCPLEESMLEDDVPVETFARTFSISFPPPDQPVQELLSNAEAVDHTDGDDPAPRDRLKLAILI